MRHTCSVYASLNVSTLSYQSETLRLTKTEVLPDEWCIVRWLGRRWITNYSLSQEYRTNSHVRVETTLADVICKICIIKVIISCFTKTDVSKAKEVLKYCLSVRQSELLSNTFYRILLKGCPDYSCSCSVSCASVNVDGFTSPSTSTSSAINRSHVPERFATVSVELSVHTGNSRPESLRHEQSGRTYEG
jgi:hypothetical protein